MSMNVMSIPQSSFSNTTPEKLSNSNVQAVFGGPINIDGLRELGLSDVVDWVKDKDKICTDGKDDGVLTLTDGLKSFGKGLLAPIKNFVNHPLESIAVVAATATATILTGGACLPLLGGLIAGIGVANTAKGIYEATTAQNDAEAKFALENIGEGVSTIALSTVALKSSKILSRNRQYVAECENQLNIAKKDPFSTEAGWHEISLDFAKETLNGNIRFTGETTGAVLAVPVGALLDDYQK